MMFTFHYKMDNNRFMGPLNLRFMSLISAYSERLSLPWSELPRWQNWQSAYKNQLLQNTISTPSTRFLIAGLENIRLPKLDRSYYPLTL